MDGDGSIGLGEGFDDGDASMNASLQSQEDEVGLLDPPPRPTSSPIPSSPLAKSRRSRKKRRRKKRKNRIIPPEPPILSPRETLVRSIRGYLFDVESPVPTIAVHALYFSRAFSAFGDRAWEFIIPLIFTVLFDGTIILAALFAATGTFFCALLTPYLGTLIDRFGRMKVVSFTLLLQNASVIGTAIFVCLMGTYHDKFPPLDNPLFDLYLLLVLFFGTIGSLASRMEKIAINKDWVVEIAAKADGDILADMNAWTRRIDLGAKIIAPLIFGFLLDTAVGFLGAELASSGMMIVVMLWNLGSFLPEYMLLIMVYLRCPFLNKANFPSSSSKQRYNMFTALIKGWTSYRRQPVFTASLSYVFLYFTVLSPGALMSAYLIANKIPAVNIAGYQGLSSVLGLLATFVIPYVITKWGLVSVGQWCGIGQVILVTCGVAALVLPMVFADHIYVFLFFLVISRFPLWGFDLAETQVMQLGINAEDRGKVNGVESALTSIASLLIFLLAIPFHDPSYFWVLSVASLCSLVIASVLYFLWKQRNPYFEDDYNPKARDSKGSFGKESSSDEYSDDDVADGPMVPYSELLKALEQEAAMDGSHPYFMEPPGNPAAVVETSGVTVSRAGGAGSVMDEDPFDEEGSLALAQQLSSPRPVDASIDVEDLREDVTDVTLVDFGGMHEDASALGSTFVDEEDATFIDEEEGDAETTLIDLSL